MPRASVAPHRSGPSCSQSTRGIRRFSGFQCAEQLSSPRRLTCACRSEPCKLRRVRMTRKVVVNDTMQRGYVYYRTEAAGQHFAPAFRPQLTPKQMLQLGVFGGKYMTDCRKEFPASWFTRAKLCPERHDARLNYFGVNASQSLA